MWTGSGLGVILNAESVLLEKFNTFHDVVVQTNMLDACPSEFGVKFQRFRSANRESMVVRGYFNLSGS